MIVSAFKLYLLVAIILLNASSGYWAVPALVRKYRIPIDLEQVLIRRIRYFVTVLVAVYTLLACAVCNQKSVSLFLLFVFFLFADTAVGARSSHDRANSKDNGGNSD